MNLGPNGFAFENYVGAILVPYGFKILGLRRKISGKCANHEIDLIASSGDKKYLVECKHSSTRGSFIGLKVSLYTHARFLDTSPYFDGEVIVCNTKISQNAKQYSNCIGQQVFSWRYPPKKSLERIIEDYKLYPITILNLTTRELEKFSEHNLMLAKNLLDRDESILVRQTGLSRKRIRDLSELAQKVISDYN